MPTIEFTIDGATGAASMKIKGIRGAGCRPIHAAVSDDLRKVLGIGEVSAEDTDEMRERPPTVTTTKTVSVR